MTTKSSDIHPIRDVRLTLNAKEGRPMPSRVLARIATTGIYLLHDVPRDLQRAARLRAGREGITLRWVLLQALREYAAGTWAPQPDEKSCEVPRGNFSLANAGDRRVVAEGA